MDPTGNVRAVEVIDEHRQSATGMAQQIKRDHHGWQTRDSQGQIDPDTNAVVQTIPVGRDPPAALALVAGSVWVSDESEGSVTRVDRAFRRPDHVPAGVTGRQRGARRRCPAGSAFAGQRKSASRRHAHRRGGARRAGLDRSGGRLLLGVMEHPGADERRSRGLQADGGLDGSSLVPDLARSIPRPTNGAGRIRSGCGRASCIPTGPVRPRDFRRALERVFRSERPCVDYGAIGGRRHARRRIRATSRGGRLGRCAGTVTFHLAGPTRISSSARAALRFRGPSGRVPDDVAPSRSGHRAVQDRAIPKPASWCSSGTPSSKNVQRGATGRIPRSDRLALRRRRCRQVTETLGGGTDLMFRSSPRTSSPTSRAPRRTGPLRTGDGDYFMSLDTAIPPFDDVRVRRALNFAVDRAAIGGSVRGHRQLDLPDSPAQLPRLRPVLPVHPKPGERGPRRISARRARSSRRLAPRARR